MSKVQLKEISDTGIIINTREELRWYLELCESAGWVWCTRAKPMSNFENVSGDLPTTIAIRDRFSWNLIEGSHKLITLSTFQEEQGLNAPQPLREHNNLRVLITHPDQARKLANKFMKPFAGLGACNKSYWGTALTVTIYIDDNIITGWDKGRGDNRKHPFIDYDELMGIPPAVMPSFEPYQSTEVPYDQFETLSSKEDTMTGTSFVTKHFVNERNVNDMTLDDFLRAIVAKKAKIGTLESIEIKSDVLNAQIAGQEADLALIIEKMEELHG